MTTAERIASWLYRDLSTRSGFREVCDQLNPGGQVQLVTYWASRIEEEIGDNRLLKALEKIRDADYRGNRHESAFIAMRALGPAPEEKAISAGVTTLAYDAQAVQLDLPTGVKTMAAIIDEQTDKAVRDAASALVAQRAAPAMTMAEKYGPCAVPAPAIDLDDFA